jgi:hypothetical protein
MQFDPESSCVAAPGCQICTGRADVIMAKVFHI